jgi:pimeloyl-ACP methyl ester carboxylesterase
VLLHAFPLDARMWEPQFALADRGWRIIAPHLRQFGDGAGDPPAASMDDYAGDVIDLLDALHVREAVVGGCSMGGYVALTIVRHAARYVQGLVLADSRAEADTPEGIVSRKRMLATVADKGPSAVVEEMLPRLVGETTMKSRPQVVERVRALASSSSGAAMTGAITALMTRPDSLPLLSTIHRPALIVAGVEDVITPPALSEKMHAAIHGSELVLIPDAGHLASLEQPDAFNAALANFLDHRL